VQLPQPQQQVESNTMADDKSDDKANSDAYWKANIRLIFGCLTVWALVSYGFAILLRPLLSVIPIGGTDLGFWFAQQGSILTFIGIIFFYAWKMNKLDEKFGLGE
jgi:putative solute:sodium symporter small subunit